MLKNLCQQSISTATKIEVKAQEIVTETNNQMTALKVLVDAKMEESKLTSLKEQYKETREHFDYLYSTQ